MRSITVNQNIIEMEYAVRGPIPQKAAQMSAQGIHTIPCNIGNPQALGQKPISYYRQITSLVEFPTLLKREQKLNIELKLYPTDVLAKAEYFLQHSTGNGVGAYTASNGPLFIRQAIANFIDKRDKDATKFTPANPEHIFITNGASEAAKYVLDLLITNEKDGIMIPIPQYPLYSASIKKAGGTQINYYPDEDSGWAITKDILEESYNQATSKGITTKAIVVINPGNPTGAILDHNTIKKIISFAAEKNIAIIADEVYQENTYGAEFHSFAKLLDDASVPLFSLHSVSKGFYGECGHRGGYLEVRNAPKINGYDLNILDILQKQASVSLCSNTIGQLLVWLMVTPPTPQEESFQLFNEEKNRILQQLEQKATIIKKAFKQMEGVKIFGQTGAMYLFPRIEKLPNGTNDFDYCMALLEKTGLTTVNGSGFGQKPGTHHLRIAFLPSEEMLAKVLPKWIEFHNNYIN